MTKDQFEARLAFGDLRYFLQEAVEKMGQGSQIA